MGEPGFSSRELVEDIWRQVAAEQGQQDTASPAEPLVFPSLVSDEERLYINVHCSFPTAPTDVESAPPLRDLKRRLKVRAGHFTVAALRQYFESERFFIAHLVRLQNKITIEHDRLAAEVVRLHETIRRERASERQRAALLHHRLEERLETLERRLAGGSPGDD